MLKKENVIFDIEAQFHTLVHFEGVDLAYQKVLIDAGFDVQAINNQFGESRSKFDFEQFKNPFAVYERILKAKPGEIFLEPNKISVQTLVDKPIGTDHIIAIDKLSSHEQQRLKRFRRSGNLFWKIPGEPVPTHQINAILIPENEKFFLITAFPGLYAPPFPDKIKQENREWHENKRFWDHHAFIEFKK